MTLREFLILYNFRETLIVFGKVYEDTKHIRIYPNFLKDNSDFKEYFDIGVYDFFGENCLKYIIRDDILDTKIASVRYDSDVEKLIIDLEEVFTEEQHES